jgi:DNA-binding NarL/FixJ family response regulator
MKKIRVILADDHAMIRSGLKTLLREAQDIDVAGEAGDGEEAVRLTETLAPDVVVIDLSMPKMSGIEAIGVIRKRFPAVRILVLTMHENEEYILQIFRSGAAGYIVKSAGKDELMRAIRAVAGGESFFSSRVSELLYEGYVRREQGTGTEGTSIPLTRREREVLALVAEGYTNHEIGKKLFISHRTVDTHRTNIMQKLDIHDVAGLVRYAIEHDIVVSSSRK